MRNNLRNLLSVPALAIAAMAFSATNADAQCPGGCFGYPTPSQPTFRTFVPATQFQRVEIAPVQTFVQPEIIIAPQQFAPTPLQQTFVSQPAIVNVPQSFPQPIYPGLPVGAYNVHPVLPTQLGVPVQQPFAVDAGVQVIPPVGKPMDADSADGMEESVQEGQVEDEIISPAAGVSEVPSVWQQGNASDMPLTKARGLAAEREKAEMEKAEMKKAEVTQQKVNLEAAERKAAKEALIKQERIVNLEKSLKRQIKRAKQASKRDLNSKLEELKAADAADATIEAAKLESADALKAKLAEIENRIQARIEQLKN